MNLFAQSEHQFSITELNQLSADLLANIGVISVKGEISSFTKAASGHWYLALKDDQAKIKCAMFKNANFKVKQLPQVGNTISCKGKLSIYPREGNYQFIIEQMSFGEELGDIYKEFLLLKEKLEKKGLFDPKHKKILPRFITKVGIITSEQGAVIQDFKVILNKRMPLIKIFLYPANVQGEKAKSDILNALQTAEQNQELDLIVIARGGGSIEDLQVFNDEDIAYKAFHSDKIIISAIGHETDFSILDFVVDKRAATPSEAAEMISQDQSKLYDLLTNYQYTLDQKVAHRMSNFYYELDQLIFKLSNLSSKTTNQAKEKLNTYQMQLKYTIQKKIEDNKQKVQVFLVKLDKMNPAKIMAQGYSIVTKNKEVIKSTQQIQKDDELELNLQDGKAVCQITNIVNQS